MQMSLYIHLLCATQVGAKELMGTNVKGIAEHKDIRINIPTDSHWFKRVVTRLKCQFSIAIIYFRLA